MRVDRLEVQVQDNGSGIRAQDHGVIFETFRQLPNDDSGRPAGSGLGLNITKRIIDFHGGSIWVDSAPGKGSKFCFTLPLGPAERFHIST